VPASDARDRPVMVAPTPRGVPQAVAVPFSYCPRCAVPLGDPNSFVQEYWVGPQTRFACWCRACSFAFEVSLSERVVGHEAREQMTSGGDTEQRSET
jgi:hypothetical protein